MNTDERLGIIETKLDNVIEVLHDHGVRFEKVNDRQELRIRSLERFRNIAIGVLLVVGSGTGAFWRFIL